MPAERLPMRQVREVLRLKYICGQSGHRIAAAIGISRYTVAEYLRPAAVVGITWPVPPELDDMALERKLFTPPGFVATEAARPQPDWSRLHTELRRPGVTLIDAIQLGLARDHAGRENEKALYALRARFEALTPRKREVMIQVVQGRLNKQIADHIGISESTVKVHRRNLMQKMSVRSVVELGRMADPTPAMVREEKSGCSALLNSRAA
jgi:DNA-binding CsgD family transcriptional regulator